MSASRLGQRSLLISYGVFPVIVIAILYFLNRLDANKGELSFIPIMVLLGVALSWQAFTIHHHKKRILPYVFAVIYATAFFASVIGAVG